MRPKLVAIKVSGGHLIPVIMRASSRGRRRRDFVADPGVDDGGDVARSGQVSFGDGLGQDAGGAEICWPSFSSTADSTPSAVPGGAGSVGGADCPARSALILS